MLKTNDLVRYFESKDSEGTNALVLGTREIPDHLGEDGQPLVTLVFVQDKAHPISGQPLQLHGTGQQTDLLQLRNDVAHISHEYSEEQQKKYGKKAIEGGRWRLLSADEASEALS